MQDTQLEAYWEIESRSTSYFTVANLTLITTYFTIFPNFTSTSNKTIVYHNVNTSTILTSEDGRNPITNYINGVGPTELSVPLTGTATVTGGVAV